MNEHGELSQWLCHDDSTINIVLELLLLLLLLSRRSRQRERLSASVLSICSFVCLLVCLSVCRQNEKKRDFLKKN